MGRPTGLLGTNRDGTSCCPFVPGQKKFPVPLSRDKKVLPVPLSLCSGTRAGAKIPGQTFLSRDVLEQKNEKKIAKIFFFKNCNFIIIFFLLSRGCPGIFRDRTGQAVKILSRPVPWQDIKISARPVLRQNFELVPLSRDKEGTSVLLSLCPGTMKGLLSLCPAGQENPVTLETLA